jgi:hypothetical protein
VAQYDVAGGRPYPLTAPQQRRGGFVAASLVAVVCLIAIVVAAIGLAREMNRPPTAAERSRAAAAEVAGRWRTWPVGKIFPATVPYTLEVGGQESARRVGIGQDPACEGAVDAPLRATFRAAGCRAMLRATYLDQLQGLAITVGVAAFPDARSAARAAARLPADDTAVPGLRALAFPGSVTARFGDAARQVGAVRHQGPYVVLATIGYADGRPAALTKQTQAYLSEVVPQPAERILSSLAAPARPDCSSPEWSC